MTAGASVRDDRRHGVVEPRPRHGRADRSVFAPTPNNDPYPLGQPRREQPEPPARRRRAARRRGRVVDHRQQHHRQRLRRAQHHARRRDQQHARPSPRTNDWWGLRTGAVTLPTPGPAVWPDVVSAVGHDLQPAGAGEPGQRRPGRRRELPGRRLRLGLRSTFCPYRSATSRTRSAASGRSPTRRSRRPTRPVARTAMQLDPNIPTYDSFFGTDAGQRRPPATACRHDAVGEEDRRS